MRDGVGVGCGVGNGARCVGRVDGLGGSGVGGLTVVDSVGWGVGGYMCGVGASLGRRLGAGPGVGPGVASGAGRCVGSRVGVGGALQVPHVAGQASRAFLKPSVFLDLQRLSFRAT